MTQPIVYKYGVDKIEFKPNTPKRRITDTETTKAPKRRVVYPVREKGILDDVFLHKMTMNN